MTIRFHLIYPITFLVIANRQFANYLVGHDGIHGLITRNKVLNDFLGRFLCLNPVFVSFESYQVNHMAHHEFLGTQVDPDKALFNFYPINFKKYIYGLFVYFISFKLLNDFISYFTPFRLMLKSRNWKNFFNFDVISFVLFHVLLFFLVNRFHLWAEFLFLWILPILLIIPYYYFVSALQHGCIYLIASPDNSRNIEGPFLLMEILLPCNTNYHGLHHEHPKVPFYALPKIFKSKGMKGESYIDCVRSLFEAAK